jgi:hypothetical protein
MPSIKMLEPERSIFLICLILHVGLMLNIESLRLLVSLKVNAQNLLALFYINANEN